MVGKTIVFLKDIVFFLETKMITQSEFVLTYDG